MIQQESRLRVADNSGASASRLRLAQSRPQGSSSVQPNCLFGAADEEAGVR